MRCDNITLIWKVKQWSCELVARTILPGNPLLSTTRSYAAIMIRRRGHEQEESSSSDEEDAFSALSKKGNAKKKAKTSVLSSRDTADDTNVEFKKASTGEVRESVSQQQPSRAPIAITSSMKRHHKPSDARKAKMDALIQELEAEKDQAPKKSKRFIPEKKGSFVSPGEEHLTTNLFVGNLAPSIAEEDLSNLFSQFGEKYISCLGDDDDDDDDVQYLLCAT